MALSVLLCFGFVAKPVLINISGLTSEQWFAQWQGILCVLSLFCLIEYAGLGKRLGGDIARTTDLSQKHVLYHMISLSGNKSWGLGRLWVICCAWSLFFFFPSFCLHLLICLYFDPWVFLFLLFIFLLPACWADWGRATMWILGCWLGLPFTLVNSFLS